MKFVALKQMENIHMKMETLHDLLIEHLQDLYSAEIQLVKALPEMEKAAHNPQLKAAFSKHLKQTEVHVDRLDRICKELGRSPKGKHCKGMEGLIAEGKELIKEKPDAEVLDAGIIAAAQKVEHYEISGYGTGRTFAQVLGLQDVANLLQTTLDEEGQTDKDLTALAEKSINLNAVNENGAAATSRK
jgi:ferritin-like metal-binding protein YciE